MNMATASALKDIDDKFCLCSICMEQLKEPKLLPCLHRYCKDCLRSIIQGSHDVIKCPECKEEVEIPVNGVNGFKTDFYSKSLVEHVQIQQSLKSDEIRECYSCSKHLVVSAYCFKCNDFLCKDCHNFHVTNKTLKDHQKHTLSLEDVEGKTITLNELASMGDVLLRCHTHPEEIPTLCCETCNKIPICIACTYGEHEGHDFHQVKTLAKLKRKETTQKLESVEKFGEEKELVTPTKAKENLVPNANIENENLIKMHEEKDRELLTKMRDIEGRMRQVKQEKQNTERKIFDSLRHKMEHEVQGVRKKYEDIFKIKENEINAGFRERESFLEMELSKLGEKRERLQRDKIELLESIAKQLHYNVKSIEAMSEQFDNISKRFEILNVMASSILASDNAWSAAHCISDVFSAATNVMEDLKKKFPGLKTISDVIVNNKQYSFRKPSVVNISPHVKAKINIKDQYSDVYGITSSGDGNIVVSGFTRDCQTSFIVVIDVSGRILRERKINTGRITPARYSKYMSQQKVASVCVPNEIGLFNVRNGSYIRKNISDVINSWPKDRIVRCVATDPVNNHILVGGFNSRDVYVFDDQLNYLHILTLPETIQWPRDMTVSNGHLIVCDYDGKKCFVTSMDGPKSNQIDEMMGPNLQVGPSSVCKDKNGFVYILWRGEHMPGQCYVVQYSQDVGQVLVTREVDGYAHVVGVVDTSQGEKFLTDTFGTHAVHVYDLIKKGDNS